MTFFNFLKIIFFPIIFFFLISSNPFVPGFRVSISPLFSSFNRPTQAEEVLGTHTLSEDHHQDVAEEEEELPEKGLGDDFINEVYRLENEEDNFGNRNSVQFNSNNKDNRYNRDKYNDRTNSNERYTNNNYQYNNNRYSSDENSDGYNNNNYPNSNNRYSDEKDDRYSSNKNNDGYRGNNNNDRYGSKKRKENSNSNVVNQANKDTQSEDIKDVVSALRGLISLLSSTEQGRKRLNKIRHKLHLTPSSLKFPSNIQVADIILGDPVTAQHTVTHQHVGAGPFSSNQLSGMGSSDLLVNPLSNLDGPSNQLSKPSLFSNKLSSQNVQQFSNQQWSSQDLQKFSAFSASIRDEVTIPPHLIPLGPDGRPLVSPDGSFLNKPNYQGGHTKLEHMFPYLTTTTTFSPIVNTTEDDPKKKKKRNKSKRKKNKNKENEDDDEDEKDIMTTMIDTVRDLPMDTKRHMMANMMFFVPMAALSMAAAGVPSLAIAPLATLIPGFLFAAFTETNSDPTRRTGAHRHGHRQRNTTDGGHGGHGGGLSGLISGLRNFYANRRENQTLQIVTDPHHHG